MCTPTKRMRLTNFTKEEELSLLEEIRKYKNIIECKTTNKFSNSQKAKDAWKAVYKSFNAKSTVVRSIEQMRAKYDNLKSKAKKEVAQQRLYVQGTGGGPSKIKDLDAVIQAVLEIINLKTVVGYNIENDSDAITLDTTATTVDLENIELPIMEEIIYNIPATHCDNIYPTNNLFTLEIPNVEVTESQHSVTTCNSIQMKSNDQNKKPVKEVEIEKDWSSYTPTQIKRPISKKLRPTVPNPAFSAKAEYYKKKLELLQSTTLAAEKRIEEEHKKKMVSLDLDIKLKQLDIEVKKRLLENN